MRVGEIGTKSPFILCIEFYFIILGLETFSLKLKPMNKLLYIYLKRETSYSISGGLNSLGTVVSTHVPNTHPGTMHQGDPHPHTLYCAAKIFLNLHTKNLIFNFIIFGDHVKH